MGPFRDALQRQFSMFIASGQNIWTCTRSSCADTLEQRLMPYSHIVDTCHSADLDYVHQLVVRGHPNQGIHMWCHILPTTISEQWWSTGKQSAPEVSFRTTMTTLQKHPCRTESRQCSQNFLQLFPSVIRFWFRLHYIMQNHQECAVIDADTG